MCKRSEMARSLYAGALNHPSERRNIYFDGELSSCIYLRCSAEIFCCDTRILWSRKSAQKNMPERRYCTLAIRSEARARATHASQRAAINLHSNARTVGKRSCATNFAQTSLTSIVLLSIFAARPQCAAAASRSGAFIPQERTHPPMCSIRRNSASSAPDIA
jgi:hypothetical protein